MEARFSSAPAKISRPLPHDYFFQECEPESVSSYSVEGAITSPTIRAEIQRYHWQPPTDTIVRPLENHLVLVLPQTAKSNAYVTIRGHGKVAIGQCIFMPANHEFPLQGPALETRSLSCLIDFDTLQPYVNTPLTPQQLAACFDIKNARIRNGLTVIAEEVMAPGFASEILVEATAASLLVELARHFRMARVASEPGSKLSTGQFKVIEDLIKSSMGALPTLRQMATECGLSHRHLTRTFKNTTGRTLSEYITEVRVDQAKQLLAKRDALIKTVAYECGFQSQSAFAAAFRKATGFSPRQYRRVALGLPNCDQ